MLREIWIRATTVQPALAWQVVAALGLVALLIIWSPVGYRLVRHLVTLVHEAGHALIAKISGRKLRGIRLHSDTSGLTLTRGRPSGLGMVATLLAGYPAPAVLGLVGAWVLERGYAAALLWGLGVSTVFPAAISAAGEVPGRGNKAIGVVSTIAYGAFLFGAPTIGVLAGQFGLDRALWLVVGFLMMMVVLSGNLGRREPDL